MHQVALCIMRHAHRCPGTRRRGRRPPPSRCRWPPAARRTPDPARRRQPGRGGSRGARWLHPSPTAGPRPGRSASRPAPGPAAGTLRGRHSTNQAAVTSSLYHLTVACALRGIYVKSPSKRNPCASHRLAQWSVSTCRCLNRSGLGTAPARVTCAQQEQREQLVCVR